jgi:long-chain fatty acid transport protein
MKRLQKKYSIYSLLGSLLASMPLLSQAAGFALVEQSVSGLGNAFAGTAAISEDATTVFANPAGMTQLTKTSFSAAIHMIKPVAKFSDSGSDVTTGGNGGDAGGTNFVPNIYYVTGMGENARFGVGINAPFGLSTEYDDGWRGRYHAVKSNVTTININPAIAFLTGSGLSFGFGVNAQYFDAQITNAIDLGTITAVSPANPALDGYSDIQGDSWSLGYNFGILFAPVDDSRVGFAYRSQVNHKIDGSADFTLPDHPISSDPNLRAIFADTSATADITMPESWALSSYHALNKHWELLGEITFTKWSQVQELVIEFENPVKTPSVDDIKFRNTYRYSIGTNYKPDDRFTYRLGFAFDEGAAQNATYRTPRVPDHDRTWLGLGFGYKQNNISFDVGYAHLFIDDAFINRTSVTGDTLTGKYELAVDILSAQFNYAF